MWFRVNTSNLENMSSSEAAGVDALPTFVALDSRAVLDNQRRGASIQIDDRYFHGLELAIDEVDADLAERREIVSQSRQFFNQIQINFDELSYPALTSASARFRSALQQLPEIQYLKQQFPETCFVVPEWLRLNRTVNYGARVYLFRDDDAPSPNEILHENIQSVLQDDRGAFEKYQGALHGYPECCIDFFLEYDRQGQTSPELASVEPIEDAFDDEKITTEVDSSVALTDVVDGLFDDERGYAYLAREFYPEPDCDRARRRGEKIYETLCETYPERLVKDHFRINAGWSYMMAKAAASGNQSRRPFPGALCREHLLFSLPLSTITETAPYQ